MGDDFCLDAETWCDILDQEPKFGRKRKDVPLAPGVEHWFFIICENDVVMIRKEYWELLLHEG